MSLGDFEQLTPQEYSAAVEAYNEYERNVARGEWNRMRMHAYLTIMPHVKRCPPPEKLCPMPWDKPKTPKPKGKPISKEAALARMQEVMKKAGQS